MNPDRVDAMDTSDRRSPESIPVPRDCTDAEAILMSRELSCELNRAQLIRKFMRIAVAQLGVERAVLILLIDGIAEVVAEAVTLPQGVEVSCRANEIFSALLPMTIAHTVMNSRERLLIDRPEAFPDDPYVHAHHPKAGLFLPVLRQDRLAGILYAENRSTSALIDRAKISLVEILAAQTAVSMENARLYDALKQENRERTMTAERLRRSEALLAEGQRISKTGAWTWNADSGDMQWSEQVYDIWGLRAADGIPTFEALMQHVHASDRERVVGLHALAIASEVKDEIYTTEFSIDRPDGAWRRLQIVLRPWSRPGERPRLYIGTTADVTERRLAEDALRRSEAHLSEAQRLSNIGSLSWMIESRTLQCSAQCRRILDADDSADIEIADILARIHPDDVEGVAAAFFRNEPSDDTIQQEFRLTVKSGGLRYLRMVARSIRSTNGAVDYVGALADVTESRNAQNALMEAQTNLTHVTRLSVLTELTASIADEMKQLLASIIANGEAGLRWLDRLSPSVGDASRSFDEIVKSAQRTNGVINRIRSVARKSRAERKMIDLADTIHDVLPLVRQELDRHAITLRTAIASHTPMVCADNIQMQQVLMNLITNAIRSIQRASGDRKDILITLDNVGDSYFRVAVTDSGAGLSVDARQHLFEPFFTTEPEGIGLGLSICRSIVQEHDGMISAEDCEAGARFYFDIPRCPVRAATH